MIEFMLIHSGNITNIDFEHLFRKKRKEKKAHYKRKLKTRGIYSSRNLPFASAGVIFEALNLLWTVAIWDLGGDVIWRIWSLLIKTFPSGLPVFLAAEVVTGLDGEFLTTVGRQSLLPLNDWKDKSEINIQMKNNNEIHIQRNRRETATVMREL